MNKEWISSQEKRRGELVMLFALSHRAFVNWCCLQLQVLLHTPLLYQLSLLQVSNSKVTLTRGSDGTELTRNRHLTDDSSIGSYKYEVSYYLATFTWTCSYVGYELTACDSVSQISCWHSCWVQELPVSDLNWKVGYPDWCSSVPPSYCPSCVWTWLLHHVAEASHERERVCVWGYVCGMWVCVSECVCVHTCTHTNTHICMQTHTHMHMIFFCDIWSLFLDTPVFEYESKLFIQNIATGEFCYRA